MKKILWGMIAAIAVTGSVNAQDVPLVTLQKGESTELFYGSDAFKQAMEKAENGNTITLGAGSFNAVNITKAVRIYGNGYEMRTDTVAQKAENIAYATRLVGDFFISLDSINGQPATGLYMEGIYSNNTLMVKKHLEAASFIKCRFNNFDFWKDAGSMTTSKDILFMHCRFASWLEPGLSQNMNVNNCIINYFGRNIDTCTIIVQNCVMTTIVDNFRGVLKNNIICDVKSGSTPYTSSNFHYAESRGLSLHSNCTAYNNSFSSTESLANVITQGQNWLSVEVKKLYGENSTYDYSDAYLYKLTDEAQKTYIGVDGSQIGIYGGNAPFTPHLTTPRIVKKEIGTKTEAGKLKINIKVETGDSSL